MFSAHACAGRRPAGAVERTPAAKRRPRSRACDMAGCMLHGAQLFSLGKVIFHP